VTIKAKAAKKRKGMTPKAVAAPAVDRGGVPPADVSPAARRPTPAEPTRPAIATPSTGGADVEQSTQTPRKPLEAAANFVGDKHHRSLGLVLVLLSMGCAVGFLIMVELQRMLPTPRKRA
jgi:hypothetical protein